MSNPITFSRKFPAYHPKAGKATYFVEKILNQQGIKYHCDEYLQMLLRLNTKNLFCKKLTFEDIESFHVSLQLTDSKAQKSHTIRGGSRFYPASIISPRVWFGKPYRSPQIIFAPDMVVVKTWQFKEKQKAIFINDKSALFKCSELCENDGFTHLKDFLDWFGNMPFYGQIICWNNKIEY